MIITIQRGFITGCIILMAIHTSHDATRDEITATVKQMIRSALDESLKRHTAFDEDTLLFHGPGRQQWWMEKIERERILTWKKD